METETNTDKPKEFKEFEEFLSARANESIISIAFLPQNIMHVEFFGRTFQGKITLHNISSCKHNHDTSDQPCHEWLSQHHKYFVIMITNEMWKILIYCRVSMMAQQIHYIDAAPSK